MPVVGIGVANESQYLFQIAGIKLRVLEFTLVEEISAPFELNLQLAVKDEVKFDDVIGNEAVLSISCDNEIFRYVHGICNRFSQTGGVGDFYLYEARVVPFMWSLSLESDCRIFQEKTTEDIVKQVLQESGITGNVVDFRLQKSLEPRTYCVQYRETDLNFISRLLEEEGIFYWFEHSEDKHVLVFGDGTVNYKPIEGEKKVVFRNAEMAPDEEYVYRFSLSRQMRTGKYTHTDYNFEQPGVNLEASDQTDFFQNMEAYDYPGEYKTQGRGTDLAKIRMKEAAAYKDVAEGEAACPRFTPCLTFQLDEHGVDSLNAEYMLCRLIHRGVQPQGLDEWADSSKKFSYANQFFAIPKSVEFRPERRARKPVVEGSQTATVVGPSGEEIYTDKHSRIKVQFHWDRVGKNNESSSCWIRYAQNWAGKGWGIVFIPRIGQEVIVDFLEGDPDCPIATGSVYNADTVPPYDLPAEKTKSTIKTRSSLGGGGYNEIRFEDKKGEEQLFFRAERNQDIIVKSTCKESIGYEYHQTVYKNHFITVKEDRNIHVLMDHMEKVDMDMSVQVGMNMNEKVGMSYAHEAGMDTHMKAGMNMVLEAGLSLTLKVGGNFININSGGVFIKGNMVMINSGGSAGNGAGCNPVDPEDAKLPSDAPKPKKAAGRPSGTAARAAHTPAPVVVAQQSTMQSAANSGKPFCAECEAARQAQEREQQQQSSGASDSEGGSSASGGGSAESSPGAAGSSGSSSTSAGASTSSSGSSGGSAASAGGSTGAAGSSGSSSAGSSGGSSSPAEAQRAPSTASPGGDPGRSPVRQDGPPVPPQAPEGDES